MTTLTAAWWCSGGCPRRDPVPMAVSASSRAAWRNAGLLLQNEKDHIKTTSASVIALIFALWALANKGKSKVSFIWIIK